MHLEDRPLTSVTHLELDMSVTNIKESCTHRTNGHMTNKMD